MNFKDLKLFQITMADGEKHYVLAKGYVDAATGIREDAVSITHLVNFYLSMDMATEMVESSS